MRFKRHLNLEHGLKQIDIAPLIDVLFLLIIFFVLTSSFVVPEGIQVKLPTAATSKKLDTKNLVITVSPEGVVYLNDIVVSIEDLKDKLAMLDSEGRVFIRAHRDVPFGLVVSIWDMCRQLNINLVNIATQQR